MHLLLPSMFLTDVLANGFSLHASSHGDDCVIRWQRPNINTTGMLQEYACKENVLTAATLYR